MPIVYNFMSYLIKNTNTYYISNIQNNKIYKPKINTF